MLRKYDCEVKEQEEAWINLLTGLMTFVNSSVALVEQTAKASDGLLSKAESVAFLRTIDKLGHLSNVVKKCIQNKAQESCNKLVKAGRSTSTSILDDKTRYNSQQEPSCSRNDFITEQTCERFYVLKKASRETWDLCAKSSFTDDSCGDWSKSQASKNCKKKALHVKKDASEVRKNENIDRTKEKNKQIASSSSSSKSRCCKPKRKPKISYSADLYGKRKDQTGIFKNDYYRRPGTRKYEFRYRDRYVKQDGSSSNGRLNYDSDGYRYHRYKPITFCTQSNKLNTNKSINYFRKKKEMVSRWPL